MVLAERRSGLQKAPLLAVEPTGANLVPSVLSQYRTASGIAAQEALIVRVLISKYRIAGEIFPVAAFNVMYGANQIPASA